MKKFFTLLTFVILSISTILSQDVRYITMPSEPTTNSYAGLSLRGGYAFNYDAIMYGLSFNYHFERSLGVTIGFDGYYMPKMMVQQKDGTVVQVKDYKLPLWNVRAGLLIGKYVALGGICGKWNIDNPETINVKNNAWFISNKDEKMMYGGFLTFILPIGKYFGLNMDFAVTNKTGFNIGAGINLTIPVKKI